MTFLLALPGADYLALAAGLVAWTGLWAWAATHWNPPEWRPGREEEVER